MFQVPDTVRGDLESEPKANVASSERLYALDCSPVRLRGRLAFAEREPLNRLSNHREISNIEGFGVHGTKGFGRPSEQIPLKQVRTDTR